MNHILSITTKLPNQILIFGMLSLTAFNISCKKDHSDPQSEKKGNLIINNSQSELNQRVTISDKILSIETITDYAQTKSAKEPPRVDVSKNYVFKLKAEVDPPVYNGYTLQATHVKIYDKYAFVTYNTQGNMHLGGIDIFDVSDINKPTIVRQFLFPHEDISSVDYYNNKLYIVGALDIDADTIYNYMEESAMLEIISLNSGTDASVDTVIALGLYVGTDVKVTSDLIYTCDGTSGHLRVFDHSLNSVYTKGINDARAVGVNSSTVYVLESGPSQINKFDRSTSDYQGFIPAWDEPLQKDAKSELAVSDKYIFAALNYGGMKMFNLDGSLKQWVPKPLTPEGKQNENYVTNSVSLNGDLVLFANGEAGLYLGGLVESNNDSLALLGKISFSDGESVNYVESRDSIIFVATGTGGLKILSVAIDDGLPPVIIVTKPCPTLYDSIIKYFPDRLDNYGTYPALFNGSTTKQIKLTKESEVYITFIYEGAGWKNSFGFYTYNESSPPTTSDSFEKTILFPNVSMVGEGGGLESGYTVKVGTDKFPAGTVIGFYLVAQGWSGGQVTNGWYTHYTDNQLNIGGYQQHTLFKEKKCGDIVMIFEDIAVGMPISYSDNDFNDIMFVISDSTDPEKIADSFELNGVPEF